MLGVCVQVLMAEEAGLVVDKEGFEKLLAHDKELSAQVRDRLPS